MKKINKSAVIIGSIVCLLPCIMGIAMWNNLPENIPVHWNIAGKIDNYAPKWISVFILPAFLAALNLLCHFLSSLDKKRENYSKVLNTMTYWLCPLISVILVPLCLLAGSGVGVKVEIIAPAITSLLLIFVGNYLPKCKRNNTMGIKLPWTLKSEENWNKTHRFAGRLWVICGIISLIFSFIGISWLAFAAIAIGVVVPIVFSFAIDRKQIS